MACLMLAPLLAQLRGWQPSTLFFVAAAVFAGFGMAEWIEFQMELTALQGSSDQDQMITLHPSHFKLAASLLMGVAGLVALGQTRLGNRPFPTATKALFWIWHGALMGSFGTFTRFVPVPERTLEYPDYAQTLFLITAYATILAALAFAALMALFLWSVAAKRRA